MYPSFHLSCKSIRNRRSSLANTPKGIYRGLPAFSDDVEGLRAIVAGANGISGDHLVCREGLIQEKRGTGYFLTSCHFGNLAARPL